jgi:type IV secretory pathway TrbD component
MSCGGGAAPARRALLLAQLLDGGPRQLADLMGLICSGGLMGSPSARLPNG